MDFLTQWINTNRNHASQLLFIVLVLTLIFVWGVKRHLFLSQWDHFPGFKSWEALPVLGHAHKLGEEPIKALLEYKKKFGDVFRLDLGPDPMIILAGYEDGCEIYRSEVRRKCQIG